MVTYGVKLERSDDLRLPEHPAAPSLEEFQRWCEDRRQQGARLAADLFSGAGGLSLGLDQAGWTVAAAVDHDDKALQTHRHNFPGLALNLDLGDAADRKHLIDLLRPVHLDLVAGGPPCQPFSRAGRSKIRSLVEAGARDANDHRRELWRSYLAIVLALHPRAVLMENVPDMALGDDLVVVRTLVEELEGAGYHTQVRLVDAWLYGVPQHRKRLIVLARRDCEHFEWPPAQATRTTLTDAIADLPRLGETTGGRQLPYEAPVQLSAFAKKMRRGAKPNTLHDHMTRPVRNDDRAVFQLMDSSTLYADIPAHLSTTVAVSR